MVDGVVLLGKLTGRPRARRRCSANGVRDAGVLAGSSRAALLVLNRKVLSPPLKAGEHSQ